MNFNYTISLGDVITSVLFIGIIVKQYADLSVMKFKVDQMWDWFNNRYSDFPPPHPRKIK